MSPQAPDDLVAKALDGIRGASAADPGLAGDADRYAAAVDDVLGKLDAGEHRDELRRMLLATQSQIADAGS